MLLIGCVSLLNLVCFKTDFQKKILSTSKEADQPFFMAMLRIIVMCQVISLSFAEVCLDNSINYLKTPQSGLFGGQMYL